MSSPGVTRNSAPDPRRLKPEHWQGLLSQDVQESQRAINLQHKEVAQHAAISKTYDPGLYRKNAKKPSGDPIPTRSNAASGYPASVFDAWAGRLSLGELRGMEQQHGWPHWDFELDDASEKTTTLEVLVKHLRNAVSHYRVGFDSDSKDLYEVTITFQDKPWGKGKPINWRTTIRADELLTFCNKLAACTLKIAEDVLG